MAINAKNSICPRWRFPGWRSFLVAVVCMAVVLGGSQWCSRDRNLRDRDLVKISRRDRDFIQNSETRDLKFETETS